MLWTGNQIRPKCNNLFIFIFLFLFFIFLFIIFFCFYFIFFYFFNLFLFSQNFWKRMLLFWEIMQNFWWNVKNLIAPKFIICTAFLLTQQEAGQLKGMQGFYLIWETQKKPNIFILFGEISLFCTKKIMGCVEVGVIWSQTQKRWKKNKTENYIYYSFFFLFRNK